MSLVFVLFLDLKHILFNTYECKTYELVRFEDYDKMKWKMHNPLKYVEDYPKVCA